MVKKTAKDLKLDDIIYGDTGNKIKIYNLTKNDINNSITVNGFISFIPDHSISRSHSSNIYINKIDTIEPLTKVYDQQIKDKASLILKLEDDIKAISTKKEELRKEFNLK